MAQRLAVQALAAALGVPERTAAVTFRGRRVVALATPDTGARPCRDEAAGPVPDAVALELLAGPDAVEPLPPAPVRVHALMEEGLDPLVAVRRAARWASYAARSAACPAGRITEAARLEAGLRGVWLVAVGDGAAEVVVAGEREPVAGSASGLDHQLLYELVWAALRDGAARESSPPRHPRRRTTRLSGAATTPRRAGTEPAPARC